MLYFLQYNSKYVCPEVNPIHLNVSSLLVYVNFSFLPYDPKWHCHPKGIPMNELRKSSQTVPVTVCQRCEISMCFCVQWPWCLGRCFVAGTCVLLFCIQTDKLFDANDVFSLSWNVLKRKCKMESRCGCYYNFFYRLLDSTLHMQWRTEVWVSLPISAHLKSEALLKSYIKACTAAEAGEKRWEHMPNFPVPYTDANFDFSGTECMDEKWDWCCSPTFQYTSKYALAQGSDKIYKSVCVSLWSCRMNCTWI